MDERHKIQQSEMIYAHIVSELYLHQTREHARVLAICDCGQSAGGQEVSEVLAERFAQIGVKTLLICADPCAVSAVAQWNGPGFSDYVLQEAPLEQMVRKLAGQGYDAIGFGESGIRQTERLVCSPKVEQLLDAVRSTYDMVLLHTPSLTAYASGKMICQAADAALLIAAAGITQKAQLAWAKEQLEELKVPIEGVIATQAKRTLLQQFVRCFDQQRNSLFGKKYRQRRRKQIAGPKKNQATPV